MAEPENRHSNRLQGLNGAHGTNGTNGHGRPVPRAAVLAANGRILGLAEATGRRTLLSWVALAHGLYFLGTGIWPLVEIQSFLAVTGPKTDLWLVRTVGVLVAVIGGVILQARGQRRLTAQVYLLAVGSALGLAAIDVVYTMEGRIAPVVLADASVQVVFAALWTVGRLREVVRNRPRSARRIERREPRWN